MWIFFFCFFCLPCQDINNNNNNKKKKKKKKNYYNNNHFKSRWIKLSTVALLILLRWLQIKLNPNKSNQMLVKRWKLEYLGKNRVENQQTQFSLHMILGHEIKPRPYWWTLFQPCSSMIINTILSTLFISSSMKFVEKGQSEQQKIGNLQGLESVCFCCLIEHICKRRQVEFSSQKLLNFFHDVITFFSFWTHSCWMSFIFFSTCLQQCYLKIRKTSLIWWAT